MQRMLANNLREKETAKTINININGNTFYGDDDEFAEKIGNKIINELSLHTGFQSF